MPHDLCYRVQLDPSGKTHPQVRLAFRVYVRGDLINKILESLLLVLYDQFELLDHPEGVERYGRDNEELEEPRHGILQLLCRLFGYPFDKEFFGTVGHVFEFLNRPLNLPHYLGEHEPGVKEEEYHKEYEVKNSYPLIPGTQLKQNHLITKVWYLN